MKKIQIEIVILAESMTFNNTYTLVLGEKNGNRRFSFVIGKNEAQSIAISLDGLKAKRPLTHDLMYASFTTFNIHIIEVMISELKEGIFYSYIVCKKGDTIVEIDSRTSDALALALRFNCPIYVDSKLLDDVGTEVNELEKQTIEQFEEELEEDLRGFEDVNLESIFKIEEKEDEFLAFSDKQLEEKMQKALEEENYEEAAKIRDELNKRKSN